MVQLFISHSTAFCFHANGSEDFNGARITPLVGAPSDLCFVLAASHLQLRGEWNLTHLCLGEKDGTEPLNMNHIGCNHCPPSPQPLLLLRCPVLLRDAQVWPDLAAVLRKALTAALARPCARREALRVPRHGPGARGQPAARPNRGR